MIEDRNHQLVLAWLFRKTRLGQFPDAYAHLYSDAGLNPDEYEAIGTVLASCMGKSGCHATISRLGVQVSSWLGLRSRASDDARRHALVADLFDLAMRRERARASPNCEQRQWRATGALIGTAEYALSLGLKLNQESLIEVVFAALCSDRLPTSRTDVARAYDAITRFGPITDWISNEGVEELRGSLSRTMT